MVPYEPVNAFSQTQLIQDIIRYMSVGNARRKRDTHQASARKKIKTTHAGPMPIGRKVRLSRWVSERYRWSKSGHACLRALSQNCLTRQPGWTLWSNHQSSMSSSNCVGREGGSDLCVLVGISRLSGLFLGCWDGNIYCAEVRELSYSVEGLWRRIVIFGPYDKQNILPFLSWLRNRWMILRCFEWSELT